MPILVSLILSSQLLATICLLSFSIDLPTLDPLYKWNHIIWSFVGLLLFCVCVCVCVYFFLATPCAACRVLVPPPGIEPGPTAVTGLSPNPWTAGEFPLA